MFMETDRNMCGIIFSGVSTVEHEILGNMTFSNKSTPCSLELRECENGETWTWIKLCDKIDEKNMLFSNVSGVFKPGICRSRDNATGLFFNVPSIASSATAWQPLKKNSKNVQAEFFKLFYFKNFLIQRKNKISLSTSVSSFALNLLKTMLRCKNNRSDVTSVTGTEIISRAIELSWGSFAPSSFQKVVGSVFGDTVNSFPS